MSIVSNPIISGAAESRYLSPGELDQIKAFVTGGQRGLRVAQVLCESRERIVKLNMRLSKPLINTPLSQ